MTEDCVLSSLIVWLPPWSCGIPYRNRQTGFQANTQEWALDQLEHVVWSPGSHWSVSSSQEGTTRRSPAVRYRKDVCTGGVKRSLQQEKLQRSVLNSTVLLPHQIYKTPNGLAPAVPSVCFSLSPAPRFVLSLISAHLDTFLAVPVACNNPISCVIYTEPSPGIQLSKHLAQ